MRWRRGAHDSTVAGCDSASNRGSDSLLVQFGQSLGVSAGPDRVRVPGVSVTSANRQGR
jgi:hypothetical protein